MKFEKFPLETRDEKFILECETPKSFKNRIKRMKTSRKISKLKSKIVLKKKISFETIPFEFINNEYKDLL